MIDREQGAPAPVYLSTQIPYVDGYWNFYLIARGRTDLLASTVYFDAEQINQAPEGSFLVSAIGGPPSPGTLNAAGWTQVAASLEPDRTVAYVVFEKRRR